MKKKESNSNYNPEKDKLVFSPQLANYLLGCGYTIIRIKQNRYEPTASVFVFAAQEGLNDIIEDWIWDEE